MIEKIAPLFDLDSKLKDIPRFWLQYIEPRIKRVDLCWIWEGAHQDGEPVISMVNAATGKRGTRLLKRIVAGWFWKIESYYDVVHECGNLSCLNPWHFYISRSSAQQENRDAMIATKKRSIRDYLARKP